MKIMFSTQFGDSIAHVLRTRGLAQRLKGDGHKIRYVVSDRAFPYLKGFLDIEDIADNRQSYGYSRLEPIETLCEKFAERVVCEYGIYGQFKPDVVIGDMGLVPSAYCDGTPLIKIVNRFFVDLHSRATSVFNESQRMLLTKQVELLVNSGRNAIHCRPHLTYSDFFQTRVLVNGIPSFVGDLPPNSRSIGIKLGMSSPSTFRPDRSVAFVSLGTGTGHNKAETAHELLNILKTRFRKIYVSIGYDPHSISLSLPSQAIMKPFFSCMPDDVGCIICHGGYGAIHAGLLLGIPIFVLPFQIEHYSNGLRLEQIQAGLQFGFYDKDDFLGILQTLSLDWDRLVSAISTRNVNLSRSPYRGETSDDQLFMVVKDELKRL